MVISLEFKVEPSKMRPSEISGWYSGPYILLEWLRLLSVYKLNRLRLYNKVFIIVRLTLNDGNANTVQEAEAMGIPAVHNISDYGLKWKSIDDVINHIKDDYDKQYLEKWTKYYIYRETV